MNKTVDGKKTPMRASSFVLAPLVAALVLAGCASAPAIDPQSLPATPSAFREGDGQWTRATPAEAQPRGTWWKAFGDPVLDELVERAGRSNNGVQVAAARLAQARALLHSTDAERAPQLGAGVGAVRQSDPAAGIPTGTLLSAGVSFSYELDLFGRLAKASDAATFDARSREALLQSTRLLVQADVARSYFVLRSLDSERGLVRDTVVAYRDTLRLIERRFQAGDVAELDVARVRSEVAATESEELALERQRGQIEHALAVLVGEPVAAFRIEPAGWDAALPVVPPGVPSTVLARRPDVSAAQSALQAAQARVGVARAAWFPSLALTAGGGYASNELSDLFKWSARTWSLGALASLPLLDGGRREAGVANARAELDAALASSREQVLAAFKDVEDERPGQPDRTARCAAQRTSQPASGAAGARGAIPVDGRPDPRARRRLGRASVAKAQMAGPVAAVEGAVPGPSGRLEPGTFTATAGAGAATFVRTAPSRITRSVVAATPSHAAASSSAATASSAPFMGGRCEGDATAQARVLSRTQAHNTGGAGRAHGAGVLVVARRARTFGARASSTLARALVAGLAAACARGAAAGESCAQATEPTKLSTAASTINPVVTAPVRAWGRCRRMPRSGATVASELMLSVKAFMASFLSGRPVDRPCAEGTLGAAARQINDLPGNAAFRSRQ
jgi:outer membrane protein, multidrug efflux system